MEKYRLVFKDTNERNTAVSLELFWFRPVHKIVHNI